MNGQAACRHASYAHSPRSLYPAADAAPLAIPVKMGPSDGPPPAAPPRPGALEDLGAQLVAAPPRPGALEDLGAQLVGLHMLLDDLERGLGRVLKPEIVSAGDPCHREPSASGGPACAPHLRDLVRGANRAANRLSAIVDRIDL